MFMWKSYTKQITQFKCENVYKWIDVANICHIKLIELAVERRRLSGNLEAAAAQHLALIDIRTNRKCSARAKQIALPNGTNLLQRHCQWGHASVALRMACVQYQTKQIQNRIPVNGQTKTLSAVIFCRLRLICADTFSSFNGVYTARTRDVKSTQSLNHLSGMRKISGNNQQTHHMQTTNIFICQFS